MKKQRFVLIFSVLVLTITGCTLKQQVAKIDPSANESTPETVSLRFNWPGELMALVDISFEKTEKTSDKKSKTQIVKGRNFKLRTEKHPDGLIISSEGGQIDQIEGDAGFKEFMGQLMATALTNQPMIIVDDKGQFLRLE